MSDNGAIQAVMARLADPFPPSDIEWRVGRSGFSKGKPWALVLAYVTNRAIMDRLDDTVGADCWRNEFERWGERAQLCGISIKVGDEWITKWDGAEDTDVETTKGGLSNAMKRAAVQWGIGRYLYRLGETWAEFSNEKTRHRDLIKDKQSSKSEWHYWNTPVLPEWAVPSGTPPQGGNGEPQKPKPPEVSGEAIKTLSVPWKEMHGTDDREHDLRQWVAFAQGAAGRTFDPLKATSWTQADFNAVADAIDREQKVTAPEQDEVVV